MVSLRVLPMSGTQSLDTGTATGRLMLAVIGAVGQAEREAMLERQREVSPRPSARAATRGVCRPRDGRLPRIVRLKDAGVRPSEIAIKLGIGRTSVYRVLGEQSQGDRKEPAWP
jgi:DNA invertase Pin-like site-specific DNA recombinase